MAGVLVLCALLLSNDVTCQEADSTDAPASHPVSDAGVAGDTSATSAAGTGAAPAATDASGVGAEPTAAAGGDSAPSALPGDSILSSTVVGNQDGGASGTIAAPTDKGDVAVPAEVPDNSPNVQVVVPEVTCVGEDDLSGKDQVQVEVDTADCEESKRLIQDSPAAWCETPNCRLLLHQSGSKLLVSSDDATLTTMNKILHSKQIKDKLTKAPASTSSGSSVFVGILVSGLLAAIALTVGYFKCQRRSDPKGVRLAEEAHPVDQENQGNTLVSVAPLNPPAETAEKPSANGESPEAAKTQDPPPTNGHSTTANTADTEM